jgi:F-type H+-transporting ATPase subunit delta
MKVSRRAKRTARGLFRLCTVGGALDESRARSAAQWIATSNRRGALPVLADFQRLLRLNRDRSTARVESAAPLGPTVQDQIRGNLARKYGPNVETRFEENPALIGGVRIQIGSDVYDDSIRARLSALAQRL